MKTILSFVVVVILLLSTPMAFAIESGAGVKVGQVTLYDAVPGSTNATNTSAFTFDNVMNNVACDLILTPASAGTLTYYFDGNQGSSTTKFFSTPYILTSATFSPLNANDIKTVKATATPFRTIRATITAPTTTAKVTINCSASQ